MVSGGFLGQDGEELAHGLVVDRFGVGSSGHPFDVESFDGDEVCGSHDFGGLLVGVVESGLTDLAVNYRDFLAGFASVG